MPFLKGRISSLSSLSLYILTLLVLIVVLSTYDNNILSLSASPKSKIVQAVAAIYTTSSDSHFVFNTGTITNIQLPGIIPNNNNNNPSISPSPSSSSAPPPPPPPNPSSNSPTAASPPIVHRNTRARPAIGGPIL